MSFNQKRNKLQKRQKMYNNRRKNANNFNNLKESNKEDEDHLKFLRSITDDEFIVSDINADEDVNSGNTGEKFNINNNFDMNNNKIINHKDQNNPTEATEAYFVNLNDIGDISNNIKNSLEDENYNNENDMVNTNNESINQNTTNHELNADSLDFSIFEDIENNGPVFTNVDELNNNLISNGLDDSNFQQNTEEFGLNLNLNSNLNNTDSDSNLINNINSNNNSNNDLNNSNDDIIDKDVFLNKFNSYLENNTLNESDSINDMDNNNTEDMNNSNINNINNISENTNNVHLNKFNSYLDLIEKKLRSKKFAVDVRIVVGDPIKAEYLSKAINNIDLGVNFPIVFSAIIPTTNIQIVKNAVKGADIVLIAIDIENDDVEKFNEVFKDTESLKGIGNAVNFASHEGHENSNVNITSLLRAYEKSFGNSVSNVELLKFPKYNDIEIVDNDLIQNELKNSIIKVGLSSILNIVSENQIKAILNEIICKYEKSIRINEKLSLENTFIADESETLKNENNRLNKEIIDLKNDLSNIKSDFSQFKTKFSDIYNKNILEMFPLSNLWEESFNESLKNEEELIIATNDFKPDNIIIGQGVICANSKKDAVEWLKVIKTALIFFENKEGNFSEFMNQHDYKNNNPEKNNKKNKNNHYFNDYDYNKHDYNNKKQDELDSEDYESFWD
ncbi:hypothetical protein [Methanobrevibacter filiformis]|uniref:Uncharacterized protein n=1 Tax=Methanobrevibacter filiformis TaxID=55758 RepID=A0A166A1K1_9EURY|nr:hypothetical protein [Methanobrevibacter filiformis]KZX11449.1 hypothetical protein MBFIL_14520 [Methanobrevibacter filiformis]